MHNIRSNGPDIFHFEKRFEEMVYEVQRNKTELEKFEKEHLSIREQLYLKGSLLECERKASQDLRARLKLTTETIERLEEEKMRDRISYSNLSRNYDSVVKQRDIFAGEALSSRTEAAKFKMKAEALEKALHRETQRREELEKALTEFLNDNRKIIGNIDVGVAKISKEQKCLLENAEAVIRLNKRLQTIGLCFHAINEKNRAEIKDLRQKLIGFSMNESKSLSVNEKLHPEMESLCFKLKELLLELKSKMEDSTLIEENIKKIFQELTSLYDSSRSIGHC
ncbi:uncharacterized protein LOC116434191 [Nomia melanderi]|uniref:uncharacterized protein LOC116434191 n=1 Tax=Nomia melanderi TaxID=2448451 RepID=UPI0013044B6C|nr:uncharacterized protein LOC116434191 [Nomia melanderi]